ncbi:hypothetical protein ABFS83_12G058000 [Erythranthe nasuta]
MSPSQQLGTMLAGRRALTESSSKTKTSHPSSIQISLSDADGVMDGELHIRRKIVQKLGRIDMPMFNGEMILLEKISPRVLHGKRAISSHPLDLTLGRRLSHVLTKFILGAPQIFLQLNDTLVGSAKTTL